MKRTTLPRMVGPALMAGLAVQFACSSWVAAADKPASVDLSEFRTVEKAVTARISQASPNVAAQVAYLGIQLVRDNQGKMTLGDVAPDSPAAKAGLERGDVLVRLAGQNVTGTEGLRELLQARSPGEKVQLEVVRQGKPLEVNATLDATSRPMRLGARRAVLGIGIGEPEGGKGVAISEVFPDSPAARANLKAGEIILKIDGVALNGPDKLRDILSEKNPGDVVTVTVQKPNSSQDLKLKLGEAAGSEGRSFREPRGPGRYWDKKVYRLAVIPVEYPDVKHNSKISIADWEKALFSTGAYTSKSPTGQEVHGSLNDYYLEQSYGRFHVEGKVFDWVKVDKNRGEYVEDTGFERRQGLLTAAMDKLLEREGEDALKDFDGICFLYAGGRYRT
ncbi:MAG: PDZ domain-containing protein, partial [Planctomycetes bacterium]|nr:PDZ domain-containing protein [Planctomycetota bacterium]